MAGFDFGVWLTMGGYASYVWSTYVAALLILGGLIVTGRRRLKAAEARVAELEALRPKRRRRAAAPPQDSATPQQEGVGS